MCGLTLCTVSTWWRAGRDFRDAISSPLDVRLAPAEANGLFSVNNFLGCFSVVVLTFPRRFLRLFCENQPPFEFRRRPTLLFVIGEPIYGPAFQPHALITFIRPSEVASASEDGIRALAFALYARIRVYDPGPLGTGDIAECPAKEAVPAFFGFRYQPPFVLARQEDATTIHAAWDVASGVMAVTDDTGRVLHVAQQMLRWVIARRGVRLREDLRRTLPEVDHGVPYRPFSISSR